MMLSYARKLDYTPALQSYSTRKGLELSHTHYKTGKFVNWSLQPGDITQTARNVINLSAATRCTAILENPLRAVSQRT